MEKTTEKSTERTRSLSHKIMAVTLTVALAIPAIAANALLPVDTSNDLADAEAATTETIEDTATPLSDGGDYTGNYINKCPDFNDSHTKKLMDKYLIENDDKTYSLNRSVLKYQEDWKNLGIVGFYLYAGWTDAAMTYLDPFNFDYFSRDNRESSIESFNRFVPNQNLGIVGDPSCFDHIQKGIDFCISFNNARTLENASPYRKIGDENVILNDHLPISPSACACLVLNSFISNVTSDHCRLSRITDIIEYNSAICKYDNEDCRFNPENPHNSLYGFYSIEKQDYINDTGRKTGHYAYVVRKNLTHIGAAWSNRHDRPNEAICLGSDGRLNTLGRVPDDAMSIEDYQVAFDDYKAYLATLPSDPSHDMTRDVIEDESGSVTAKPEIKEAWADIAAKDGSTLKDPYTMGGAVTYYPYVATTSDLVITVKYNGKVLAENTDYKVTFANADKASFASENTKPATATVTCLTSDKWPAITLEFAIKPASSGTANPGTTTTPTNPGDTVDRYEVFGTTLWLNDYTKVTAQGVYTTTDGNRVYVGANGKVTTPTTPVTVGGVTYRPYTNADGTRTLLTEAEYAKTPEGVAEAKAAEEASKPSTGNGNPSTSSEETKPSTPGTTTTTTPTTPQAPSTETKPSSGNTTSTPSAPSKPQANASSTSSTSKPSTGSTSTPSTVTPKPNVTTTTGQATPKPYIKTAKDKAAINKAKKALKKVKPTLKSVKAKGKKKAAITVKPLTKAQRKQASGLQVQYANNKKFTKATKTKTAKATAKTVKLTKLASKKTVYVRVRAYKDVALGNGSLERVYGPWSKVKSVKVK